MVVSLLEEEEETQLSLLEEGNAARSSDVQFISFPIPDRGVPASTQAALTLVTDIERALEAGRNVAIHCRQSIGRAGLIAAAVLVASGVDPDQALETLSSARGAIVPETPEQREWVRRLASVQKLASST
jgi:protein-tyrosine phosphatase